MRALLCGLLVLSVACGQMTPRQDGGVDRVSDGGFEFPGGGGGGAPLGGGTTAGGGAAAGGTTAGGSAVAGGSAGGAVGGGSAGGVVDAGPSTTLTVSGQPRRGPIAVDVTSTVATWELQLRTSDGGTRPATLLRGEPRDGGFSALTWQSFDDAPFDGRVQLEVASGGAVLATATVNVRNDPATQRLVLVGHPNLQLDGGGVTNLHDEISVGRWDGTTLQGTRRLTVGRGPDRFRAAPHGRACLVVEDRDGTFSVVETPLDPSPSSVRVLHRQVRLPDGSVIDARFSPDGRAIYVVGSAVQGSSDYRLWRFTPSEDLLTLGVASEVALIPGPALRFDTERDTGRLVFPVGPGLQNRPDRVMVLDPFDGLRTHVTPLTVGSASGFAVSPRGSLLLVTDEVFTPGASAILLGSQTSTLIRRDTAIPAPADVVFHPDATAMRAVALISQPFSNRVTPVVVTPTTLTVGTAVTGVPLAAASDLIERGPDTGVVLIESVTDLFRVTLNPTGTAANRTLVIDFGARPEDQVRGVAIQR